MSEWSIDLNHLTGLSSWLSLGVGATHAYPGAFPPDFQSIGINPRMFPRNTLIGSTVSHPTNDEFVVGITFFDTHDNGDNEDYYVYRATDSSIRKHSASEFEQRYPAYADTHRGLKGYLRPDPSPSDANTT